MPNRGFFSVLQTAKGRQITHSLKTDNQTFRPVAQCSLPKKKPTMVTDRTTECDKNVGIAVLFPSSHSVPCVRGWAHIFFKSKNPQLSFFSFVSEKPNLWLCSWMNGFLLHWSRQKPEFCLDEELCSGNIFRTTQKN